jgi:hypothetical protein
VDPVEGIPKRRQAGTCTQCTVFFSKRRKNSSLCVGNPAVFFLFVCWRTKYEVTFQTAAEKYGTYWYPVESVEEICGQFKVVVRTETRNAKSQERFMSTMAYLT